MITFVTDASHLLWTSTSSHRVPSLTTGGLPLEPTVGSRWGDFGRTGGGQLVAKAGQRIDESIPCRGMGGGEATARLIDTMNAAGGYRTISVGHDRLQFARTFRPTWAVVVAVLLTPAAFLGLFFLLVRTTETCLVVVESDHKGTRLTLRGRLRDDVLGSIRAAFSASSTLSAPVLGAPVSSANDAPRDISFAATAPDILISAAPASVVVNGVAPIDLAPGPLVDDLPPPVGSPVDLRSPVAEHASAPPAPAAAPAPAPAPAPALPPGTEWVLQFDDGRCVAFGGFPVVLVGRDPTWAAGDDDAGLIAVDDPTLSVSKTHLAIGIDASGGWVVDRNSTNGTSVFDIDGTELTVPPDQPRRVQRNGVIRFGARYVKLAALRLEEAS